MWNKSLHYTDSWDLCYIFLDHLFTSAAEPLGQKKKKKGQEGKNSILLSGLISFFVFHQMKKVRGLQMCFFFFFFANGHKRSIRISENRKCNTNHKCTSKKISVFFILQMKPQIYNPLYTVESGFKTTCCLPMIWTAVCRKVFHIGHHRKKSKVLTAWQMSLAGIAPIWSHG